MVGPICYISVPGLEVQISIVGEVSSQRFMCTSELVLSQSSLPATAVIELRTTRPILRKLFLLPV